MQIAELIFNEGYNKYNTNVADKICAPNFKHYWNGVPAEKVGPDAVKDSFKSNHEAYDDYKFKIVDMFAKEDKLTVHWAFKGKHKLSGQQVSFSGASILRFEKGKVVEGWTMYDFLGLYKQLGYTITPPAWAQKKEK